MLQNISVAEELRSVARAKAKYWVYKTVSPTAVDKAVADGWEVDRPNDKSVRLRRLKPHGILLEDRVWVLFYRMGFKHLSGAGGAKLVIDPKNPGSPSTQVDVVGIDDEAALVVECKSSATRSKRSDFPNELARLSETRDKLVASIRTQFPSSTTKRNISLLFFTNNAIISDNDALRAKTANVALFTEKDLEYYENLVSHIGPAARYQFLADVLGGKSIPGLEIRLPAVKSKMGGFQCYTFSITPEYLLKISYVSHRAKGKPSDVNTYQRMLKKSRLNRIREYIDNDGIFPTNIVVNIDKNRVQFERVKQNSTSDDAGILGWLTIRPAYKSAWIIDGQHRLFAYSGHRRASKSRLSVLAFEGLEPSKQAELFIDINAKQKRVPRSLLEELFARLHWDSDNPVDRVSAIVSQSILDLDADPSSPFFERVQKSDDNKDPIRCISLTSLFTAIDRGKFHISKEKQNSIISYGPLWAGDNPSTRMRTVQFIHFWFDSIRVGATEWWDKGAAEGGGLAMNDSITACVQVLRSILSHVEVGKVRLVELDEESLIELVRPFAEEVGRYLGGFTEEERKRWRALFGSSGQTKRRRMIEAALNSKFLSFNPAGLDEYLKAEKAQTNLRSKTVIDSIEKMLQETIIEDLKREYPERDEWWWKGIPKDVRKKVDAKMNDEDGKRGGREYYFDLIDYKHVAAANWVMFEGLIGYGKGGKDKRLAWLDFVNERRKVVAHVSSGVTLSLSDLETLQSYEQWLRGQLSGEEQPEGAEASV